MSGKDVTGMAVVSDSSSAYFCFNCTYIRMFLKFTISCPTDLPDNPPVADAGHDLVVQPQDSVTLNGIQSRDDIGIESYKWDMLSDYPYAVIEVRN